MSREVQSISADATVFEAAQLLVNMRESAIPVVDGLGKLVGIVSEADLIRNTGAVAPLQHVDDAYAEKTMATAHGRNIARIMSTHVVTADEDSSLQEISDLMLGRGFKRIPIVRAGALVGIVSRVDLLRALLSLGRDAFLQERPGSPTEDRALRATVIAALERQGWAQAVRSDVVIAQGIVHLWGVAPSEDLRDTYVRIARDVAGVTGVKSRLQVAPKPSS